MDDFQEKIKEFAAEADRFISTPEMAEKLIREGYPIQKEPPLSTEKAVEKLFQEKK
jgi:hypothetical protein